MSTSDTTTNQPGNSQPSSLSPTAAVLISVCVVVVVGNIIFAIWFYIVKLRIEEKLAKYRAKKEKRLQKEREREERHKKRESNTPDQYDFRSPIQNNATVVMAGNQTIGEMNDYLPDVQLILDQTNIAFNDRLVDYGDSTIVDEGKLMKGFKTIQAGGYGTQVQGMTLMALGGTITSSTLMSNERALTVPAFLEMKYGQDFSPIKQLAKGGGGIIYIGEAKSPQLKERCRNEKIIIKVQIPDPANKDALKLVFDQEVATMYYFNDNPYFAKMYAFCSEPQSIVMKFYPLGALQGFIYSKRATYTKVIVVHLLKDISKGLKAMHDNGLAHCDIKPQNILLEQDSYGRINALLTDFGIARIFDSKALLVKAFQKAKIEGGSLFYASPEVLAILSSTEVNFSTIMPDLIMARDIYSFAVMIAEMITRRMPTFGRQRKS
ncbi:hypothetical protein MP638_006406 [Amoeboaphelidium occidentale]|nr:hypothetical protein MP638_006406 [Amoeboaphelidium occidentale]